MLTASRALRRNIKAGEPLPRVEGLRDLYAMGFAPRRGNVIMVAGRSGSGKSALAQWWTAQLSRHGLSVLYFSADMSPFTASARLASMATGHTLEEVEQGMESNPEYFTTAADEYPIRFAFDNPLTLEGIEQELLVDVALNNRYPDIIVIDNLVDFEGGESDYQAQMSIMQYVTELSRITGATVLILHHATDKTDASVRTPPSRRDIKSGLSEKPELTLTVAVDPDRDLLNIAVVKQRMGPADPTGTKFASLKADLAHSRLMALGSPA